MKYRALGKEGINLSVIALGTTRVGPREKVLNEQANHRIAVYHKAIEYGINLFDTAELYGGGYAEEILGRAIEGRRKQVYIASKFNPHNNSYDGVISSVEGSLRRLRTDYLDIYQIHWPNPLIDISETILALDKLVNQGKIRLVGFSNFSLQQIKDARKFIATDSFVSIEDEYNQLCFFAKQSLLKYSQEQNLIFLAYSPLNRGQFALPYQQQECVNSLICKYKCTYAQLVLAWILRQESLIAVTKTNSFGHLKESVDAISNIILTDEDSRLVETNFKKEVEYVNLFDICADTIDDRGVYTSKEEALGNVYDWIPSPEILAANIECGNIKPIRLIQNKGKNNKHRYHIDRYDFIGEMKKYWGWIIARGKEEPIPAYIQEDL